MQEVYLQEYTTEALSLFNKGKLNLKHNNYSLAAYYFQKLLCIDPQNFWAFRNLGKIATEYKLFPQAITYYQQAIDIVTFEHEAELNFIIADLAHLYLKTNAVEQAEQILLQRLETQAKCVFLHTSLAEVYENYTPALIQHSITAYKKALELKNLTWVQKKITQHQQLEYTAEISNLSLLLQGNWINLLQRECNLSNLNSVDQQQLYTILQKLPMHKFANINEFRIFLIQILMDDCELESISIQQQHKLSIALELCLKYLQTDPIATAYVYIQTLKLCKVLEQYQYNDAESIILKALLYYDTDVKVLVALLKLLIKQHQYLATQSVEQAQYQQILALIRLISSELISLDAQLFNKLDLDAIIMVHNEADKFQIKKFATIKKFLLNSSLKNEIIALNTLTQYKDLIQIDQWMTAFFDLIANYNPALLFDLEYYQQQAQLPKQLTIEQALAHYFTQGWQQRLAPHPMFDIDFIEQQLVNQQHLLNQPTLLSFLQFEKTANLIPNILINPIKLQAAVNVDKNLWLHYLSKGWQNNANISDFFDLEFYLTITKQSLNNFKIAPILDFCKTELIDCNRFFHTQFYFQQYKATLNGKIPLVHYLTEGVYLGYQAHPFIDSSNLTTSARLQQLKLTKQG